MNDFVYTVEVHRDTVCATDNLPRAREIAIAEAIKMDKTSGHTIIKYWTRGEVTDTEHHYAHNNG